MKRFILNAFLLLLPLPLVALPLSEINILIKRYAPLIKIAIQESSPTSVKWYINRCALKQRSNNKPDLIIIDKGHVTINKLGTYKTNPKDGEYFLDPLNDKETLKGQGYINNISDTECYVTVVQRTPGTLLLQYWFFYANQGVLKRSDLTTSMMKTLQVGEHQGDWEHISVHLKKKNGSYDINQIFFSRHREEDGEMVPKEKINFVNDNMQQDINGTHAIVYSARNSHASYPKYYSEVRATKFLDYLSNDGPVWRCWTNPIYIGTIDNPAPGQEWILFAGRWGATLERTAQEIEYHGNSPFGPAFDKGFVQQGISKSPITISIDNKAAPFVDIATKQLGKKGPNIRFSKDFSLTIPARIKRLEWSIQNSSPHDFTYEIWKNNEQLQFGPLPGNQPFVTNLPTSARNLYVANIKATSVANYELGKPGLLVIHGIEED